MRSPLAAWRRLALVAFGAVALILIGAVSYRVFARRIPPPLPAPRMARAVPVRYYVSRPVEWQPNHYYPIVVTVEGVGHDFAGNFQSFVAARGDRPFLVVTPFVRSNGNDPADLRAVLAIVREVQEMDGGQPKFFVTGFSAGGHLAWQLILKHPEMLVAAVPAAANFDTRDISQISNSPARVDLPIHAFQGNFDTHLAMMNRSWQNAQRTAKAHGFDNIGRTMVRGAGHSAFPDQTLDFFESVR